MNVLVVDDEKLIREVIKEYASLEKYNVYEAENGIEALKIIDKVDIDVIVLDIMMPKMDGYTFFKELKKEKGIPTIILSARNDEYDKLLGFELGVDDYLTKPFSPKELMARIKAITRRGQNKEDKFVYKTLVVDFVGHTIEIDNKEVNVTPKEFEILTYFINNKNVAISREALLNKLWGYDYFGDDRTIDTHIKMLRNNLGIYRDLIKTVRGIGYKFEIK